MIFGMVDDFLDKYGDDRTKALLFASSVWKPILIVVTYIVIVKKIGPWFMETRQPYDVRKFIIGFDVFQILANFYLAYMMTTNYFTSDTWFCCDVDYSDSDIGMKHLYFTYSYYLLKISDTLDTIFFILKKNYRQVSHLHLYHHTLMILYSWVGLKFVAGGQTLLVGITNAIVHCIMYSYYLLSAVDDSYKGNLAMKKFVTQVQIGQFILLFIVGAFYVAQPCKFPRSIILFGMVQAIYFMYLFGKFYYKEYIVKPKKAKI